MPKRKHSDEDSDDEVRIRKKIRRMEKKLKKRRRRLRHRRRRLDSNPSSSDESSSLSTLPTINKGDDDSLPPMYEITDSNDDLETAATVESVIGASTTGEMNATAPTPAEPSLTTEAPVPAPSALEEEMVLDQEILTFLGEAPSNNKKYGPKLQSEIAARWEHVATSGVTKEVRKEFLEKYLTPENCSLIDPPALNLEVKAALTESLQKKDTAICNKQKQISAAISCIGQGIKRALLQQNKDSEMIKILIDAGRIVCDIQHTESSLRRGFIGSCIKKEVKDHLNDTRIDKYLFGEKLADTLKAAKTIHKSGSEIRVNTSITRPIPKNKSGNRPLNSKPPAAANRPPPPAGRRFEEPAPAQQPQQQRRRPPPPTAQRSQQRPRAPRR